MTERRAEKLVDLAPRPDVDSLLVPELTNLRYISGFTGTNGACLIGPDTRTFFTDFRYTDRAAAEVEGFEIEIVSGDWLAGLAGHFAGQGRDRGRPPDRSHRRQARGGRRRRSRAGPRRRHRSKHCGGSRNPGRSTGSPPRPN